MKITAGILAACIALPAMADEASYDISGFSEIKATSGLEVEISFGEAFSIRAEGKERALARLVVELEGTLLKLKMSRRTGSLISRLLPANDRVEVLITLPLLNAVEARSGTDVTVNGAYADAFDAVAFEGANLSLHSMDASDVSLESASGADLEASGTCVNLSAHASSGAELDADALSCETAVVSASSGADLSVRAVNVEADASSAGDIEISGASVVNAGHSSGGSVSTNN